MVRVVGLDNFKYEPVDNQVVKGVCVSLKSWCKIIYDSNKLSLT